MPLDTQIIFSYSRLLVLVGFLSVIFINPLYFLALKGGKYETI
jgi:hypothetical protein